ncbi:MAG: 3-hydroxyacyl-CoA dehydrogenase family protein [Rhizobiales bacterium]|nr:3-hydroxyacyl-CoA dehydrogenase family protein [Hyphomicrobiales bacterium]
MGSARVAVIGAGLMGHGIALAFAAAVRDVAIYEPDLERHRALPGHLRRSLRLMEADEADADRVAPHRSLADAVAGADLVIEAVPEDLALKQEVFAAIEAAARPDALLASNTSVIPITAIMEGLRLRARAMGTHWWNPPHLIPLVEVVQGRDTGAAEIAAMMDVLRGIGKMPVHVRKDVPGFIGNRLQHAMWREAIALVQDGVCDAETIDTVVKASFGRRLAVLGPLENADLVGTDLALQVHHYLLPHLDRTPEPQALLRDLVATGRLGMKSAAGFRDWSEDAADKVRADLARHLRTFGPAAATRNSPERERPPAANAGAGS